MSSEYIPFALFLGFGLVVFSAAMIWKHVHQDAWRKDQEDFPKSKQHIEEERRHRVAVR
jgi:hypothetical protein